MSTLTAAWHPRPLRRGANRAEASAIRYRSTLTEDSHWNPAECHAMGASVGFVCLVLRSTPAGADI